VSVVEMSRNPFTREPLVRKKTAGTFKLKFFASAKVQILLLNDLWNALESLLDV